MDKKGPGAIRGLGSFDGSSNPQILTGRNLMDALRKGLSTVGKWAAQPAKGRKPKKAASGSSPAALGFAWFRRSRRALTSVGRVS
jgi:hypothetical protein